MQNLPDPLSFNLALEQFIAHLKSQNRSTATTIAYGSDLNQLKKHLNGKRITQATTVQTIHLQDYVNWLAQNGYTPKSISRKINSLKTFFKFLHEKGVIPHNPSTPLAHPKIESHPPRVLSAPEIAKLRDAIRLDIRVAAIVELLLQTGMRISELANLRLDDIKKGELYIRPQESNPARVIPLARPAQAALNNYLAIRPPVKDDHVFVTKTGRHLLIRNIRSTLDRYFAKAGLKNVKVNDLRHTFIAHQIKNGVATETVNKHVGHKRLTSTQKYLDYIRVEVSETRHRLVEL